MSAILFFTTFTLIVTFVIMNMFIAIIVEGFQEMTSPGTCALSKEQFEEFCGIWSQFDPNATYKISMNDLEPLLLAIPAPLGFGSKFRAHNGAGKMKDEIKALGLRGDG